LVVHCAPSGVEVDAVNGSTVRGSFNASYIHGSLGSSGITALVQTGIGPQEVKAFVGPATGPGGGVGTFVFRVPSGAAAQTISGNFDFFVDSQRCEVFATLINATPG
jgi:hypothetical protein